MTETLVSSCSAPILKRQQFFPGSLLTPFGWAAEPLTTIVAADPVLLRHVFELDRPHMHMIAMGLAHLDRNAVPKIGPALVRCSSPHVLTDVLGPLPAGLKRVLRRLPFAVLSRENYRRLIELLDDPGTAKVLLQDAEPTLDGSIIEAIYGVPAALRAVLTVVGLFDDLDGFADGLRMVASRGAAPTFDALVADLVQHVQPAQFIARLRQLVAGLPLPEAMPPHQIAKARRLDCSSEIRRLAKQWQNCLASYVPEVDAGLCAIYLWDDPTTHSMSSHPRRSARMGAG